MSERGDIIRGAGAHLKRNSNLGVGVGAPYGGSEGDVRVQMVDGSPRLYGRAGGEWYSVNLHKTNTDGYKLGSGPDYLDIPNTGFEIVNVNKLYAELDKGAFTLTGGTITLRNSTNNNDKLILAEDSLKIYDNNTEIASYGATTIIGAIADDTSRIELGSGNVKIINRQGSTDTTAIELLADGSATFTGTLVVGGTTVTSLENGATGDQSDAEIRSGTGWSHASDATKIDGGDIYANTVTASQIAAATITASEIAGTTITAAKIAGNTITASQIASDTITANEIAGTTITAAEIASNTITASQIASDTITINELAEIADIGLSGKIILAGTNDNVLIGTGQNTNGDDGVILGVNAGASLIANDDKNVFIGKEAGRYVQGDADGSDTCEMNVFIGRAAGQSNDRLTSGYGTADYTGCYNNVAVGEQCLANIRNGIHNVAIGDQTLGTLVDGQKNIALGYRAGKLIHNSTSMADADGTSNICIGYESGDNITSGAGNVIIGAVDASSATVDTSLILASGDGTRTWLTGDSNGRVGGHAVYYQAHNWSSMSASGYLKYPDGTTMSSTKGFVMPAAGSLTGFYVKFNVTATSGSGDKWIARVYKNGSSVLDGGFISATTTGWKTDSAFQAKGTDTFVAGDIISMYLEESGGSATVDDIMFTAEVIFDV